MIRQYATTMLCLFATNTVAAAPLSFDALPQGFATQLANGAVQANVIDGALESYVSYQGFNAYSFDRNGNQFTLISYDILPGSQWDVGGNDPIPLGGQVFVEVPQFVFPGDSGQFTLHLDQVSTGIPFYAFWSNLPETSLVLQPDAVTAGSGIYQFSGESDYIASGNMMFASFNDHPFICIECQFFAQLDLVFLDYSGIALTFNFDDPRTTLFTGFDSYDESPYGWGLDLVVNQVPLPAALPLLLASLMSLGFLAKQGTRSKH